MLQRPSFVIYKYQNCAIWGQKKAVFRKSFEKVWRQPKKLLSLHPLNETKAILIVRQMLQ